MKRWTWAVTLLVRGEASLRWDIRKPWKAMGGYWSRLKVAVRIAESVEPTGDWWSEATRSAGFRLRAFVIPAGVHPMRRVWRPSGLHTTVASENMEPGGFAPPSRYVLLTASTSVSVLSISLRSSAYGGRQT